MNPDAAPDHDLSTRPLRRRLSRPAGLVALAGLTVGGGFALASGISSATGTSTSTTAPASTSTAPTGAPNGGWGQRPGGMGGRFGHGFGDEGTVTTVSGSTLTLRTENGTETVKTTSSTKYTKEQLTVTFTSIKVGDVVRVQVPRPTSATVTPGTGTVTATQVEVVLPRLSGRVTAVGSDRYTLVGQDGQLVTVTTTGGTRYYNGTTKTTAAAVKVGSRVVAEGSQSSLTALSADTVTVVTMQGGGWGPGGWGPGGHR